MYILGFDIGGTKSAVVTASWDGDRVEVLKKDKCPTDRSIDPYAMIDRLISMADSLLDRKPDAIGISCGGPLDSGKGVIMSPPNLPEWDGIEIVDYIEEHYGVKAHLQNDANACALAEWKFGAGKGSRNMVFMTFGTGLGAGLILNGELYEGTNGNAGEVGHIRLKPDGPIGFGKAGSFEGFCSGGGIAQIGRSLGFEGDENGVINAKTIADAAYLGNEKALETYRVSGEMLGYGLSVLIDILNPEVIVIGSVFARSRDLLWTEAEKIIEREALSVSSGCCRVVPAQLGESIGDFGAIATALV